MSTPDDIPRIEATLRLLGALAQMIDGLIDTGPRGKLLRRATDDDGRNLFSKAETPLECVWWADGSLKEIGQALRAAMLARECGEACQGKTCGRCKGSGYVSRTLKLAPTPSTLPTAGDVSEFIDWIRGEGK